MAAVYGKPTVTPNLVLNPERAAMKLQRAMRGIGTDEKVLIDILGGCANFQRQEIKKKYKTMYGRELSEDLTAELGGNFEDVCLALLNPTSEYLADCLHAAMKGLGTDEWCIVDIMCTHKNHEIAAIKNLYQEKYKNDLETDLKDDLSGDFKDLIRSLVSCGRDETIEIDDEQATEDANQLKEAGVGRLGTDESFFNSILAAKSYGQLQLIFEKYKELTESDLEEDLAKEFSGDVLNGYTAIVKSIKDIHGYYAERLHDIMKGPGTDDTSLIRIIVSRAELDLQSIKEKYRDMYGKELAEAVADDTSGDYRKLLLKIIG
uniref:Annexin n=1 Tax=Strigamia maritima TaxID=126957 RepID=T1J8K7_STRMM